MWPIVTDRVAWSVGRSLCLSVCRSVTPVSPIKTAKPIEMPFGLRIRVGAGNHVLDVGSGVAKGGGEGEGPPLHPKSHIHKFFCALYFSH